MSSEKSSTKRNPIFVYYRVVALLCILFHHSMTACFGIWPQNTCLHLNESPFLMRVSTLSKFVGLGCFTFMAGYFAYASMQKYKPFLFLKKKVQHILVPCLVCGGCYYFLFPQYMGEASPINGTHLWYLPMIFLCFAVTLPMGYIRHIAVGVGTVAAILLSLRIGTHFHLIPPDTAYRPLRELVPFLPVFVCGCLAGRYPKNYLLQVLFQGGIVLGVFLLYLLKGNDVGCYLYILFPVVMYSFVMAAQTEGLPLPFFLKSLDRYSFNIYLIHQFVINSVIFLVEKGGLPGDFPFYILFVVTVAVSWGLSYVLELVLRAKDRFLLLAIKRGEG